MTNLPTPITTTAAFQLQAAISFGVSVLAVGIGIAWLPVDSWIRAFLGLGLLYTVTSTFTLAKTVRDAAEAQAVRSRVDEARLDKLISDHDPFRAPVV